MKTNPEHTKEMLRHSILDRKLNESGLYMNPKLGRFINEAMQEYSDECNPALASHVQSELSKTNAGYWRKMYELSRSIIHKLNIGQTYEYMPEAVELEAMEDQSEPPSELSTKIAEIEKTFTNEWIKEWSSDEACEADGGENKRLAFFISVGANKLRSEILKVLKGE